MKPPKSLRHFRALANPPLADRILNGLWLLGKISKEDLKAALAADEKQRADKRPSQ